MSDSGAFDRGDEVDVIDEAVAEEAASAREQIRRALLWELLHGELVPTKEDPKSENWVAERHGGTRMPVRMALAVLAGEGLIRQRSRHGFWVIEYRLEDIRQILEMRADVEARIVADLAGEDSVHDEVAWQEVLRAHGRMAQLVEIGDAQHDPAGDDRPDTIADLDTHFHAALAEAGDYQIAASHIEEWSNQMRLFEVQNGADDSGWPVEEIYERHVQLLKAIDRRDPDAAVFHIREELDLACRRSEILAGPDGERAALPPQHVVFAADTAPAEAEAASAEGAEPAGA